MLTMVVSSSTSVPVFNSQLKSPAPAPNFITDIFFITLAMHHYGYIKTITVFEDLARQHDEMVRHLGQLEGNGEWRGVGVPSIRSLS